MEALQLQGYDEWLAEHLDELVGKYPAKVVAIHEGKIVSIGDTEADVYRRVREAGLEPMPLVFRVPCEEDLQSIGQLSRLLETLSEELQRLLGSDLWLLMLYGSHARGEAQLDSDVDLFVVLRRASEVAYEKVRQVAYEMMWEADFAYVFSLYLTDMDHYRMLEQRGSSFLRNVQKEGKVLWKAA
ncbi:MAG: nucleotidyltransferase domain-containing protein [Anaerolineae bacterium]